MWMSHDIPPQQNTFPLKVADTSIVSYEKFRYQLGHSATMET